MNANVSKGLMAYVLLRDKYFADTKNLKALDEIEAEIFLENDTLPIVEIALILKMIREDYERVSRAIKMESSAASFKAQSELMTDYMDHGIRYPQPEAKQFA